jgi:hypothetical protein
MVRASRYLYLVLASAVVVGLVVQVFLIGLGLLGRDAQGTQLHASLGWLVHWLPVAVVPFAYLSRAGSRHWHWALASAVVVFLTPLFVIMRDSAPLLGALHPLAAVLSFPLSLIVAMNSWRAVRALAPETRSAAG